MTYGQSSSRRWKTNIGNIPDPLEKIGQRRSVHFNWNEDHVGLHDIGFIAEEIGVVLPEIVGYEENGIDAASELDYRKIILFWLR
ncbi:MAG: tail fiber domain-containing protein [Saprospiraceae bacterium]|nr:tail fiber domain-containing protein [Saprospiraceae bacterium]